MINILNILAILLPAFLWLGYESDWMRVRLAVGEPHQNNGRWQFQRFGEDCIMMRTGCQAYLSSRCNLCHKADRFFTWRILARTIHIGESTIHFEAGCNLHRAKLLKDIMKARNSKAVAHYPTTSQYMPLLGDYYPDYYEPSIEILVDGNLIVGINGNYERGMVKEALKPYTTRTRIGKRMVTLGIGEADRQAVKV